MFRATFVLVFVTTLCLPRISVAQSTPQVPKKILDEMQFLVGEWETEGTYQGADFRGTYAATSAPGKHCLIMNSKSSAMTATGVNGWDPTTKDIVETWYRTDGFRIEQRFSHMTESVWEGTVVLQDTSGETQRGTIRLEKGADGNSFIFTGSVDGESLVVRNRRVTR